GARKIVGRRARRRSDNHAVAEHLADPRARHFVDEPQHTLRAHPGEHYVIDGHLALAVPPGLDRQQLNDRVAAARDAFEPGAPVDLVHAGQKAHVAEVDAGGRYAAAEHATEGPQYGAVAAQHEAEVDGPQFVVVDDPVAVGARQPVLVGFVCGYHA